MNYKTKLILILLFLIQTGVFSAFAAQPNSLFTDHMVVQQKVKIPVWGTGRNGERVTVELGNTKQTTVVTNNKWKVVMPALKAGGPYTLRILGDTVLTISDVYAGEVWICSGQSNMGRRMSPHQKYKTITNYEQEKAAANHPLIRQYTVNNALTDTLVADARGSWKVCSPDVIESFSAVAYFFARDLQQSLNVPVGIILTSVGGTQAKLWTSRQALTDNPGLKYMVAAYDSAVAGFPAQVADFTNRYDEIMTKYHADSTQCRIDKKPTPKHPVAPRNPTADRHVSCYFNGMIAPLIPYALKGFAWYQGESDVDFHKEYNTVFTTLIKDWRKQWSAPRKPFLFVQIAPFKKNVPELREAQLQTLQTTRNTAMIVTTDCGDPNDIHPPHKQPIGNRLSLAARAIAYHQKLEYSGPMYSSYRIKGNRIILRFTHTAGGLMATGNELKGFTLMDEKGVEHPAKAIISGNTVILSSDQVASPRAAAYGWSASPNCNLINRVGLPASPFRTQ